ncbi:MAG: protein kinase [Planctomycetota bacterium]
MASLVGELIHERFRVVEEIGSGATAIVYRAFDELEEKSLALKVLRHTILHSETPEAINAQRRFDREARLILRLEHSDVTPAFVFAALTHDPWFIAMELIEGASLRKLIIDHPKGMSPALFLALAHKVASGLERIHTARILHRDLAPENIIATLNSDGEIATRFLDFGFGRPIEAELDPVTKTTTIAGTPQYLAPEQTQSLDITERADVYALGCILFELVTGRVPIPVRSIAEIARIRNEIPPPLATLPTAHWMSDSLSKIIDSCLHKNPGDRPSLFRINSVMESHLERPEWRRSGAELLTRALLPKNSASDSVAATLEPDQRFGPWRLLEKLFRQPDATTWSAYNEERQLSAALVIFDREPALDPSRERAGRQMKERPQLKHSQSLRAISSIDGYVVWDQEFIEGRTLRDIMAPRLPLDENRVMQLAAELAEALSEIHNAKKGLLHGYLSAGQVLVDEFDGVKLLNGGRPFDFQTPSPFQESAGDRSFFAPERQLGGPPTVAGDIWSFGALLHLMLSGTAPFEGPPLAVAWRQWNELPQDALADRPDFQMRGLGALAALCLSRKPQSRPATGAVLLRLLGQALADRSWNAESLGNS